MKIEERNPDRFDEDLLSEDWGTEPVESGFDRTNVTTKVEPGTTLGGRYQLGPVLGSGGAGRVFTAFDGVLSEHVALKVLREERAGDRSWIRRLAREVKIARLIRHPNVCRVFELGNEAGIWFITMELAEGGTLRGVLLQRREASPARTAGASPAPSWEERLQEARAVCAGLAAIHAVGIVHRDVTPQNVLRMGDGRLVLSDFGLAIPAQESTTFLGGTPRYMAPEVVAGRRADQRSDVYQLGLVMHEILFGRRAEWQELAGHQVLKLPVDPQLSTPAQEEAFLLCADCLKSDPAARPADAMAVAGRLAAAEHARPRGRLARVWRRAASIGKSPACRWAVVATLFLAIGAQAGRVALRPHLCSAGRTRVAAVWGPANKEVMRRAFLALGKPEAPAAFENVTRLLDEHVGRWLAAYSDACEATQVRGEQSAEVLDLRMTCLNDDLDSVRAVARVLSGGNPAVVDRAVQAASALDDLGRCADIAHLRGALQLPKDPVARKRAEDLRRKLLEAAALSESEQCERGQAMADAVIAESEAISYCPTQAEALAVKALCVSDTRKAISLDEKSFLSAEACGHGRAAAMASADLVYAEGLANPTAAEQWGRICWAELERLGGDRQIEGWLLNNLGVLRFYQGRFEEARQFAERAIALKSSWLGPDALDIARSEGNLALAMFKLGRGEEALKILRRMRARYERWLGRDPFDSGLVSNNEAEILLDLGQTQLARELFDRALGILANNAIDDEMVAFPLTGLGKIAIINGDLNSARVLLERALKTRLRGNGATVDLAETRFQLARALGKEARARACRLAVDSLAAYPAVPGYAKERREVQSWLSMATCRKSDSRGGPG